MRLSVEDPRFSALIAGCEWRRPVMAMRPRAAITSEPPLALIASTPVRAAVTDAMLIVRLPSPWFLATIPLRSRLETVPAAMAMSPPLPIARIPSAPPDTAAAEIDRSPEPAFLALIPSWPRPPATGAAADIEMPVPLESLLTKIPRSPPVTDPVVDIDTSPPPVFTAPIPSSVPDISRPPAACASVIPATPSCASERAWPGSTSKVADAPMLTCKASVPLAPRIWLSMIDSVQSNAPSPPVHEFGALR